MQLVEDFFLDQRYHFGIQSYVMRAVRIGRRCSSTVEGLSLNEITSRSLQNLKTRVGISGVLWKPSQVSGTGLRTLLAPELPELVPPQRGPTGWWETGTSHTHSL